MKRSPRLTGQGVVDSGSAVLAEAGVVRTTIVATRGSLASPAGSIFDSWNSPGALAAGHTNQRNTEEL